MFAIFPEILQAVQKGDLETLACLIRKYFAAQETYSPRLSVEALLTRMGISVQSESGPRSGPGIGQIRALDQKGQYIVILSLNVKSLDRASVNFTLAHLLGYFLLAILPVMARGDLTAELYQLEGDPFAFRAGSDLRQRKSGGRSTEADHFAMALLLPQGMVKKAHERFGSALSPAAKFFGVDPRLLEQRLLALGCLAQARPPEKPGVEAVKPKPQAAPKPSPASSVERAQKSLVSMSYRREESRTQTPSPASSSGNSTGAATDAQNASPGEGLKRLRELAKKIDRSVDV